MFGSLLHNNVRSYLEVTIRVNVNLQRRWGIDGVICVTSYSFLSSKSMVLCLLACIYSILACLVENEMMSRQMRVRGCFSSVYKFHRNLFITIYDHIMSFGV